MKHYLIAFLALTVLFTSCKSSTKILETGDYDAAINNSIKRLAGKKKKKAEEVDALELAFVKANGKDLNTINSLKKSLRSDRWEEVYRIARQIEKRQSKIEPLLPLYDEYGQQAKFKFIKINQIKEEARSEAANQLYQSALGLLGQAERGDKPAARQAYEQLDRITYYFDTYKDRRNLMLKARNLGVSNILFRMVNNANVVLPKSFEKEILTMDTRGLDALWKKYYFNPDSGIDYDYEIVMDLRTIDISPERIQERTFTEEKEIEEGTRSLRDDEGNVVKDSLGNVITIPVIKVISADVLESYQTKAAILGGELIYFDKRSGNILDKEPIAAEALFEHYASTFRGDRRALSTETKRYIGNSPMPFPTDADLLFTAAGVLKPIIKEQLERSGLF